MKKERTHHSGLAKSRLTCFVETFVVKQTFVLRMNFSAKIPALRQAAKRYVQFYIAQQVLAKLIASKSISCLDRVMDL